MTVQNSPKRLFSTSLLAAGLLLPALPALALDADDFATKLAALSSQSGNRLSFSAVEPDGSTVVLKSVRIEVPGQAPIAAGDITFKGVEEEDDGSYFVSEALFEDVEVNEGPTTVTVEGIEMTGLSVPGNGETGSLAGMLFYEGFSTGEISVDTDDVRVFSMAGVDMQVERQDDGSKVDMRMNGSDLEIDLSTIDDPKARDAIQQLGYETLTGDIKLDAAWDATAGTVNMQEYSLSLDEVGRLSMSMEISGYTLEFINAMQQAQASAAANPDPQAAQQALGFAMLGMLQQLSFNSASVRFEDASVTERALAFAGKQQGVSGDQMRMALKGMLPLMLGRIGIPELQKQIAAAASVYLDNPENITITAAPASPVAVPVIMGAGMGDPKSLVDLLNVQVSANKPVEVCCKQ